VSATAADTQATPQHETLPDGFELTIELSKHTVARGDIVSKQVIGKARVQLQKLLGQGGMADAYLGQLQSYELTGQSSRSRQPPQQVVVKLLHPPAVPLPSTALKAGFLRIARSVMWQEYALLESLSICSDVINTYGFGTAAAADGSILYGLAYGMTCILLEWAELGDLQQKLQPSPGQSVPMSAEDTWDVALCVMSALVALHRLGHIHRDVKPGNVLVTMRTRGGRQEVVYKLSDFGLAASVLEEFKNDGRDGTEGYRPPEKYWCYASDTYSFGKLILACRSAADPQPGTYEELRASGVYDNLPDPMRDVEWELLRLCLIQHGSDRPRIKGLLQETTYFGGV
jgi:serine/threonine protein kinase